MDEALLIRDGFATPDQGKQATKRARPQSDLQIALFEE